MKKRSVVPIIVVLTLIGVSSFIYISRIIRGFAYAKSDNKASSVDKELVDANTKFAFKLFKELMAEDRDKNTFISPFSISTALTMAYKGAGGSTKVDMSRTLELVYVELSDVNEGYLNLIESLEGADRQVSLEIANSVWMDKGFEPWVYPTFTEGIETNYKGEILTRDFSALGTVDQVNAWISEKTDDKIDEVMSEIDPEIVMFLINAIHFKGDWTTKFDVEKTSKGDFYLLDGTIVRPDMMSTSGNFSFYSEEDFKVARLPYGRDKIAMYIFLPSEGVSVESLLGGLNQTTFDDILSRLYPVDDLKVKLPKFKLEYGTKRLNDALIHLGMGEAFDMQTANFSGIAPIDQENLYIDFVDHKAFIEVNEQGTEAAAATVVRVALSCAPIEETFYVERPFFFVIRDDRSGSILFMGSIVNPLQSVSP
jgi:serine protease inhibitor